MTAKDDDRTGHDAGIVQGKALAGTTAIVTGASGGIGAATALALARQGGTVALVARRRERLTELTATIAELDGSAIALTADLRDAPQIERAVQDAVDHFGRLDVLVNNAGYAAPGPIERGDPDDWDRMLDLNVRAVLRMTRCALPHLLRAAELSPRRVTDLVNVSSVAGRWPRKNNNVYSATKHAVGAFSEGLRQEMAGRGVRVGTVEPGMVETEMTEGTQQTLGGGMSPELWLRPDDIARAVVYMVTQPPHAGVNEIMVRPAAQEP